MKSLSSKLIPVAIASVLCGVAMAGGGKDDKLSMMDKNGDGKVTQAEHSEGAKMMFSKLDTNKDGSVTAQEMDAAEGMTHKEGHATARTEGTPDRERMEDKKAYDSSGTGKSMPKGMSSEQKIAAMDTNNDGKLSAAEHAAGSKQMFSKMDADGDGTLTAQEWSAGHRKQMTASDAE